LLELVPPALSFLWTLPPATRFVSAAVSTMGREKPRRLAAELLYMIDLL
jgi:hypothetical protein